MLAGAVALTMAASAVAQTMLTSAVAQTMPTPPPRPQGLAPEATPRDPSGALRKGTGDVKPGDAATKAAEPPAPPAAAPARPEALGKTPAAQPAKPDSSPPAAATPPAAPSPAPTPADACLAELAAMGVDAPKAEAPAASEAGCVVEAPVRLKSVTTRDGRVAIHGEPLIACAAARAASAYLIEVAAPLAKGATGVSLTGVTAAGFECRARNRAPGGKLSAHGKGLALDVSSFQFADATTMTVAAPTAERTAYFAGARKAACGYFTTVLGPGADEAHRSHLHLDVEAHGTSGAGRICQ